MLERFCNHAGDAVTTDQIDFSAIDTLVTGIGEGGGADAFVDCNCDN